MQVYTICCEFEKYFTEGLKIELKSWNRWKNIFGYGSMAILGAMVVYFTGGTALLYVGASEGIAVGTAGIAAIATELGILHHGTTKIRDIKGCF